MQNCISRVVNFFFPSNRIGLLNIQRPCALLFVLGAKGAKLHRMEIATDQKCIIQCKGNKPPILIYSKKGAFMCLKSFLTGSLKQMVKEIRL